MIIRVTENLTLPLIDQLTVAGLLSSKKVLKKSQEIIKQFEIKLAHPAITVGSLSGGNQQRVVIGKWLATDPEILMMDEPTAGVDIGTKGEILDLVRTIANSGKSVILISSELPELLSVSDRILVMKDGRVSKSLDRKENTQRRISSASNPRSIVSNQTAFAPILSRLKRF